MRGAIAEVFSAQADDSFLVCHRLVLAGAHTKRWRWAEISLQLKSKLGSFARDLAVQAAWRLDAALRMTLAWPPPRPNVGFQTRTGSRPESGDRPQPLRDGLSVKEQRRSSGQTVLAADGRPSARPIKFKSTHADDRGSQLTVIRFSAAIMPLGARLPMPVSTGRTRKAPEL